MDSDDRRIILTSPLMAGRDVKLLQAGINARRHARGMSSISVDGRYGVETAHAMRSTARFLGAAESTISQGATIGIQRIIRNPSLRTPVQLYRAKVRAANAKKNTQGAQGELKWAREQIGIKESPAGTNSGPHIRDWEKSAQMGAGPWCGAFARFAANTAGADITYEARYVPSIQAHALAGTGGYSSWHTMAKKNKSKILIGSHICFDWEHNGVLDHVGILEDIDWNRELVVCIEGNTSKNGSQDNGGAVERQTRSFDLVGGAATIRW